MNKRKVTINVPDTLTQSEFKQIIDKLCAKGIANSSFNNYSKLMDVLEIFSRIELALGEQK